MRYRRAALLSGTHLCAIAVGMAVGWYFGAKTQRYVHMLSNVGAVGVYSMQLDALRREGNDDAYRDALLAYSAFLENVGKEDDPFLTKQVVLGDKVLILARLARLERRLGREAEWRAYLDQAVQACLEIPWKRCDAPTILDLSERGEKGMDEGSNVSGTAS